MSSRIQIPKLAALIVILGGIVVGATLFSLNNGDASTAPSTVNTSASDSKGSQPIQAVEPAQKAGFSLFRTPAEGVPPNVKRMFADSQPTTNVDLAQQVDLKGLSKPLWVIPGDNLICLFLERPGGGASSCGSTTGVLKKGLDLQLAQGDDNGPVTISTDVGLVSDEDANHVVAAVDSGTREVPVTNNAYLAPPDSKGTGILNDGSK